MDVLLKKFKNVLFSVSPITIIVTILNFTITPLGAPLFIRFLVGVVFIIIGLTIFLLGVDIGITPIGRQMGASIAKTNKLWMLIMAGLVLGFAVSVAEPALHIIAQQIENITAGSVGKMQTVLVVSLGLAITLSLGFVRIVYNIPLNKIMTLLYFIVFVLACFTPEEFFAISFDSSGATTGAVTVPFILALAAGVSALKKDSKASNADSFGMVGVATVGTLMAIMIMGIMSDTEELMGSLPVVDTSSLSTMGHFLDKLPVIAIDVAFALLPVIVVFAIYQKLSSKFSKKGLRGIVTGIIFTFLGLLFFMTGVNGSFLEIGNLVGRKLALFENHFGLVSVGFILGFVVMLSEPAVYVLTSQIEDVTSGYVKRKIVIATLSLGVGIAVALSMVDILSPNIKLWHFLLPGYVVAIVMSYYVPKLFVGIAFDSGGVASGLMTTTFVLAFAHGAADAVENASLLADGFGLISMVALTPIIALQLLGAAFQFKAKKGGAQ